MQVMKSPRIGSPIRDAGKCSAYPMQRHEIFKGLKTKEISHKQALVPVSPPLGGVVMKFLG